MAWSETADGRWDLMLECPNCGSSESGTFTRLQVEQLEDHLDGSLLSTVDPDWVTAFFEHTAGRRQHPGEARPAG